MQYAGLSMPSPFLMRHGMPFLLHFPRTAASALLGPLLLAMLGAHAAEPGAAPAQPAPGTLKIYKSLSGGVPSFSDVPPTKGPYVLLKASCYACSLTSTIDWHVTRLYLDEYTAEIEDAARQFAVAPALVRAMIHAESGFNPRARSPKGALGLMQLMPATARDMGVQDTRLPRQNISGGTRYLAGLLAQFKGDVSLAAAAYNAGPDAVRRYAGIPPFEETRVYVQRVKILLQRYQGQQPG